MSGVWQTGQSGRPFQAQTDGSERARNVGRGDKARRRFRTRPKRKRVRTKSMPSCRAGLAVFRAVGDGGRHDCSRSLVLGSNGFVADSAEQVCGRRLLTKPRDSNSNGIISAGTKVPVGTILCSCAFTGLGEVLVVDGFCGRRHPTLPETRSRPVNGPRVRPARVGPGGKRRPSSGPAFRADKRSR